MEDEHSNFSLLVEEGGAGDGFLARWPPQLFANSGFLSTFAGHRALAPLASCAFLAPGSEPSHRLINNLHDSVRELLNQTLHDWVQIAVLGVAVGSQEPIPTVVVVLRPGDVSVARAKILVEKIVKIQQG